MFGNAAQLVQSNLPIIFGAVALLLGGFLLLRGAYGLYRHSKQGHHHGMSMAEALWSLFAGFIVIGIVAFAAAGTILFTGAPPTAGAGGAVVFQ